MDSQAYGRLERRLVALARSTGPMRAVLAQLAAWLVQREAWKPLGYARLSDYADEGLGRSARSLRDLAHVGQVLSSRPQLRAALVRGDLGWTKVRLLARVCTRADEGPWIEYARSVTSAALSREVRRVDTGSQEHCDLERDGEPAPMVPGRVHAGGGAALAQGEERSATRARRAGRFCGMCRDDYGRGAVGLAASAGSLVRPRR